MPEIRVIKNAGQDPFQAIRIGGLILLIVIAILIVNMAYYSIDPEEVGVVTRLGKFVQVVDPGLHFKVPIMENVTRVETKRQHKSEFGYRSTQMSQGASRYAKDQAAKQEALMLTGDLNAADVEWIVQYTIADPVKYLFKVRDPVDTLRDLSESVMRGVIGDRSIFEVLTVGRAEINVQAKLQLQELLDTYETGLRVEVVQLQTVGPPDQQVKDAFNLVNQSEQEKQRSVNKAKQEYNDKIPLARGTAEQTIKEAEGYRIDRVNRAKGEAARFLALLEEYQKAPEVTRRRLYLETMAEVLPLLGEKVIVDEEVSSALPLLHLGKGGSQ